MEKSNISTISNRGHTDNEGLDDKEGSPQPDNTIENVCGDETAQYLKYLEYKLKRYPPQTRNIIKLEIRQILSGADRGLLDKHLDTFSQE